MSILTISYKKIAGSNFISYVFHCFVNFLCIFFFFFFFDEFMEEGSDVDFREASRASPGLN